MDFVARPWEWMYVTLFENYKIPEILSVSQSLCFSKLPRRKALWKDCWHKELKPPTREDWPAIKKDFNQMMDTITSRSYTQWTVMVNYCLFHSYHFWCPQDFKTSLFLHFGSKIIKNWAVFQVLMGLFRSVTKKSNVYTKTLHDIFWSAICAA